MRLKSFGECMVEFDQNMKMGIGGDTFNTCASATLFGLECEYTMQIANDIFKPHFINCFKNFKVEMNLLECEGQNGLYFIANDSAGERSFQYYRKGSAASTLSFKQLGNNYLDCDIFYNSGITAALSPELNYALELCYKTAKAKNIITVFDVNFREKLWSQSTAISFLEKIIHDIDILLISEDDLPIVANIEHPFVVQRQGAKGVSLIQKGVEKKFKINPLKAIDTSGAGDVFTGAMLAQYSKNQNWVEAIEFAIDIAGKHIQYFGALPQEERLC